MLDSLVFGQHYQSSAGLPARIDGEPEEISWYVRVWTYILKLPGSAVIGVVAGGLHHPGYVRAPTGIYKGMGTSLSLPPRAI